MTPTQEIPPPTTRLHTPPPPRPTEVMEYGPGFEALITSTVERFDQQMGAALRWRIEDKITQAANQLANTVSPVMLALTDKLDEVEGVLRNANVDQQQVHNEVERARLDFLEKHGRQAAELHELVQSLRSAASTGAAPGTYLDLLRLERITFWQIVGAVVLGGCAVIAGACVVQYRHDQLVKNALIDSTIW